ncbi:hypothetical protein C8R44DRAFT_727413 [Mycena epipterygia]|nr:hypothetical protein C8R44DRAFT_727413 [Mycena epipterygia]
MSKLKRGKKPGQKRWEYKKGRKNGRKNGGKMATLRDLRRGRSRGGRTELRTGPVSQNGPDLLQTNSVQTNSAYINAGKYQGHRGTGGREKREIQIHCANSDPLGWIVHIYVGPVQVRIPFTFKQIFGAANSGEARTKSSQPCTRWRSHPVSDLLILGGMGKTDADSGEDRFRWTRLRRS